MDKDILLEMIKNQEEAVKKAKEQLEKLYTLARQNGIIFNNTQNISFKSEIETRRKEMMENAEKIRKQAMEQASQAMAQYSNKIPNMMSNMSQQDIGELIKKLKEEK